MASSCLHYFALRAWQTNFRFVQLCFMFQSKNRRRRQPSAGFQLISRLRNWNIDERLQSIWYDSSHQPLKVWLESEKKIQRFEPETVRDSPIIVLWTFSLWYYWLFPATYMLSIHICDAIDDDHGCGCGDDGNHNSSLHQILNRAELLLQIKSYIWHLEDQLNVVLKDISINEQVIWLKKFEGQMHRRDKKHSRDVCALNITNIWGKECSWNFFLQKSDQNVFFCVIMKRFRIRQMSILTLEPGRLIT